MNEAIFIVLFVIVFLLKKSLRSKGKTKRKVGSKTINTIGFIKDLIPKDTCYDSEKDKSREQQRDIFEAYEKIKVENSQRKTYHSKLQKGIEYEFYIAKYFRNEGYKIYMNGLNNGKKDDGIDVICHKDKETILIQCKNWKYPIEQKDIRAFIGDCHVYINKNAAFLRNRKIRKIFITSNEETKKAVELYVKENQAEVEYITIPMFD